MAGVPVVPEGSTGPVAGAGAGAETGAAAPTPAPTPATTTPTTTPTTTTPVPTTTAPGTQPPAEAPQVVLQRRQKTTAGAKRGGKSTARSGEAGNKAAINSANNNVAGSPQSIAQSAALAAVLASSQASVQALSFYRVPLFLLPIYKAAAVQYGIPWQILAGINEIETDFGNDQSVSSAGAVGWMQFMPATWMQYGVDALEAGYADPYNPVDAIFAAARYLRAAGAQQNMRGAILAYNHSEEYVNSVILRAKLISTYPKPVIASLTGLVDGRLPVTGKLLSWGALPPAPLPSASATAGTAAAAAAKSAAAAKPGSTAAPTPAGAVAASGRHAAESPSPQLIALTSAANANVVAVQDGRVTQIGTSPKLGHFIVLRDVYGDEFTYAGLGSLAPSYAVAKPGAAKRPSPAVQVASSHDPAPSQAATAGTQAPVTLQVKTPAPQDKSAHGGSTSVDAPADGAVPAGMGHPRLLANPGNPDARAAATVVATRRARRESAARKLPLRKGSVVTSGTVLGTVATPHGASAGHLRFALRPAGDSGYVDPGPILANWGQLQKALHPPGAAAKNPLLGATAGDVFLLSKPELQRTVLSDPAITIYQCGRQDIAAGKIDQRVLAVLAFLSRSGLQPTVTALRCGQSQISAAGGPSDSSRGDAVEISAINGMPLARHQGPGTITDLTIRALLTLPSQFVPHEILSLMHYPGTSSTRAVRSFWNRMRIGFEAKQPAAPGPATPGSAAHSATKGKTAPVPVVTTSALTPEQWSQLVTRIAGLATPKVQAKPSSAAIPDPKKPGK
ncbi:MAG TPA: lytic murein transglycosylase [Solirubrobacteraceae bacterium]